jgi:hypothetical protein
VEGVVSPARTLGDEKIGIDLVNLATGEQRELARRPKETSEGYLTRIWCIDPATLSWGNRVLREVHGTGLLILDEIGPLEINRGIGLMDGLELIDQKRYCYACLTIRPAFLEHALDRWQVSQVIHLPFEDDPPQTSQEEST